MFLAPDLFQYYRLPFDVETLLVVGGRLHLKPLLRTLRPDGRFFVLALSQSRVRLLEGTRHEVREVDLAGVPQGLADALRLVDEGKIQDAKTLIGLSLLDRRRRSSKEVVRSTNVEVRSSN